MLLVIKSPSETNFRWYLAFSGRICRGMWTFFVLVDMPIEQSSRPKYKSARSSRNGERCNCAHWLLLDIPVATRQIAAGSYSGGVTARGKKSPRTPDGLRQGVNDFTVWFANDPNMKGTYFGYGGPAPPWNDSVVHRYTFTLCAVDVPKLEVKVISPALTSAKLSMAIFWHRQKSRVPIPLLRDWKRLNTTSRS
jgi:hypothetical protein